jgi:Mg/Co/Ni transporter MgtE
MELITFGKKKEVAKEGGSTKQNQKIAQLVSDLNSGNENKMSAALKALQTNGDISILAPVSSLLMQDLSEKMQHEVLEFLSILNDSRAADVMIELIKDQNYGDVRRELLSTLWNSKLDYSYYLPEFVAIAVDGDFMEALECLTIIENLEGPFEERHILESQLHLKDYLEDTAPKDPQKAQIMSEIALIVKDFNESDDDDISYFNE